MKRTIFCIFAAFLLGCTAYLYAIGEKTISIGALSGWEAVVVRAGLAEIPLVRPQPVLALVSNSPSNTNSLDLYLSPDERNTGRFTDKQNRWQVSAPAAVETVNSFLARSAGGAIRFFAGNSTGSPDALQKGGPIVIRPGRDSLFAPHNRAGDFSIEFWLFPLNLESGEQLISWSSSRPKAQGGGYIIERIQCTVSKNRLLWEFNDFFSNPHGSDNINISFSGSRVIPKDWSHHLIRFDSGTGLLEYLVDGRLEALDYASSSRREGGEVYTPLIGNDGSLVLGGRFSGLIDEFRIYSSFLENPALSKFPQEGRAQTKTLDLGSISSRVIKIEAFGGRTGSKSRNPANYYAGDGNLKFGDHSEIQFFIRVNNSPYGWDNIPWIPVRPGEKLPSEIIGRYIQAAADFYSSGNGESTPYLDELRIIYKGADLPRPPAMLSAIPADGAVELSWRASASGNTGGYLVYFGTSENEYFGNAVFEARAVKSPVDAGNRTSIRIDGLINGTLYYFAVAPYDNIFGEEGEFSREAAARPLQGSPYKVWP
ncbi:MAG: hypothetical protein LBH43_10560 [Treponema sp.]|jgi:hypothetical protein|nr:hypothetical protein [Treponema sp.]